MSGCQPTEDNKINIYHLSQYDMELILKRLLDLEIYRFGRGDVEPLYKFNEEIKDQIMKINSRMDLLQIRLSKLEESFNDGLARLDKLENDIIRIKELLKEALPRIDLSIGNMNKVLELLIDMKNKFDSY